LPNRCAIRCVSAGSDILDPYGYDVTAAKLAVDRQIEHRKIACATFDLEFRPDRPDVLGSQRWLCSRQLSLIPGSRDNTFEQSLDEQRKDFEDRLTGNRDFFGEGSPFANRGLGSVTGRLGYTWGPAMLYAKGGFAWADTRVSNGLVLDSGNGGRDGYTVGGGLEYPVHTAPW
jgi:hypothetical protein